jgi:16S rRNA (cytosine1402-N4)-methyltransferase
MGSLHVPVMVREVLEALRVDEGGWYVDCTEGLGGHTKAILEAHPAAQVLGVDMDPHALEQSTQLMAPYGLRFQPVHSNFKNVEAWRSHLPEAPRGILVDLGLSGYQLKTSRGFSFNDSESLDMRMNPLSGHSAAEFLQGVSEEELAQIIRRYGEEPMARRIAKAVVEARDRGEIRDASALAAVVKAAIPRRFHGDIHPATRTFQAIRIHVNRELEGLSDFLERAVEEIAEGGRIAVLAYHSLEDRIVKHTFRALAKGCICPPKLPVCACGRKPRLALVGSRAQRPTPSEVAANPASRSARLRVGERL